MHLVSRTDKKIRKYHCDSNASIAIRWVNKCAEEKPHEWEATSFFLVYWNAFRETYLA